MPSNKIVVVKIVHLFYEIHFIGANAFQVSNSGVSYKRFLNIMFTLLNRYSKIVLVVYDHYGGG